MSEATFYDVFLSHNSHDKALVEQIAQRLVDEAKLRPFLDKWHLIPGVAWQPELEDGLRRSKTVAVFIGPSGNGPWQHEEMQVALKRAVREKKEFRVIPVLLAEADASSISEFLQLRQEQRARLAEKGTALAQANTQQAERLRDEQEQRARLAEKSKAEATENAAKQSRLKNIGFGVAAVAVVAAAIALWQYGVAEQARGTTERAKDRAETAQKAEEIAKTDAIRAQKTAEEIAATERTLRKSATDSMASILSFSARRGVSVSARQELLGYAGPLLQNVETAGNQDEATRWQLGQQSVRAFMALEQKQFDDAKTGFDSILARVSELSERDRLTFRMIAEGGMASVLLRSGDLDGANESFGRLLRTVTDASSAPKSQLSFEVTVLYRSIMNFALDLGQALKTKGRSAGSGLPRGVR